MLKIGDTIYRFDGNHRVYRRDADGRAHGGPIFEKHFVPFQITGETPRSWLCNDHKVSKSELKEAGRGGFHGHQWFTAETMDERIWAAEHRHKIIKFVEDAPVATLKRIAELVGYKSE